jgi:hypothetical protein
MRRTLILLVLVSALAPMGALATPVTYQSDDSTSYGELFTQPGEAPDSLGEFRHLSVDFIGHDLPGAGPLDRQSLANPAAFEAGAGRFAWWTWDAAETKRSLREGVFLVDSRKLEPRLKKREPTAVPEPATLPLLALSVVLLMIARRKKAKRPDNGQHRTPEKPRRPSIH